jgi:hypothetical protein
LSDVSFPFCALSYKRTVGYYFFPAPPQHAATASWRKQRKHILQLSGLQIREGGDAEKEVTENTQNYNAKCVLKPRHPRCVLRGGAPRQRRATAAASDAPDCPATLATRVPMPLRQQAEHATGQSVEATNVNSLPLDNSTLWTVTVVQQFMTEFNGALSEEEKIVAITKIVLNLMKQSDH